MSPIGWEMTEILAFEAVEISWNFVWYQIICYNKLWDVEFKGWPKLVEKWCSYCTKRSALLYFKNEGYTYIIHT